MAQFRELTNSYRLEKILASGRSATVLRAVELASGRSAALKLINVSDPAGLTAGSARLNHLAETVRALGHPGLPKLLDWGFTTEGSAFLAMDLLPGVRFDSLAGDSPERTLPLLIAAVEAAAALAAAGLAHLNLSPANLWIVPPEEQGREGIKLLGLGTPIFRPAGAENDSGLKAPELSKGAPGDSRSDVYALAQTLCHMLGASIESSNGRHSVQLPLALSFDLANADVLREVLERSLEEAPEARPSLAELRSALRLALGFTEPAFQEGVAAERPQPKSPSPAVLPGLAALDMTALDLSLSGFPETRKEPPSRSTPPPAAGLPPQSLRFDGEPEPVFEASSLAEPPPLLDFGPGPVSTKLPPLPPLPPMAASPLIADPAAAFAPLTAPPPLPSREAHPAAARPLPPVAVSPSLREVPAPRPTDAAPPVRPPVAAPVTPSPVEPEGDVLRSIDDEFASVLAAPLPAAPAPTPGRPQPQRGAYPPSASSAATSGPQPPAAPSRRILGLPKLVFLGGAAALVLLAFFLVAWWFLGRAVVPQGNAELAATPARIVPPPATPPTAKLEEALQFASLGDDYRAWGVLASISSGEQGALSPESCRALAAVEESLVRSAAERLPADLPRALATGDLDELRGMTVAASRAALTLPPDAQEALGKINSALTLYGRAQAAMAANRPEEALDHFAAVVAAVPNLSDPEGLRDRAAEALVARAEPLARKGSYDEALAQLEPVRRSWPGRPELAELVTRYESSKRLGQEQEALLATLPNFERRRKPHEGLQAISDTKPVPHLEQRFAEARTRLQNQLQQLDGKPPQVVLRDGFSLLYSRGTVANLSFRVSDDYEVVNVRMFAAPEGGKMRSVPLEKARGGSWYSTEIRPDFHRNGTVRFYVTASDLSGQEGTLGSAAQPLELKRSGTGGFR